MAPYDIVDNFWAKFSVLPHSARITFFSTARFSCWFLICQNYGGVFACAIFSQVPHS